MNDIYWITRLDGINTFLLSMVISSVIVGVALIIIYSMNYDNRKDNFSLKWCIIQFVVSLVFGILYILTPTTK